MSTIHSEAEYKAAYDRLPPTLRTVIDSTDSLECVQKIQKEHNLHFDQIGELHSLILDVLYGFISPTDFVQEIERELKVDHTIATQVATAIDQGLFKKVRGSLMSLTDDQRDAVAIHSDDRDALLREIQNPTPTPVSGRRYALQGDQAPAEDLSANGDSDASGSVVSNPDSEARIPDTATAPAYASILDKNAVAATSSDTSERKVDPYLEIPE